MSYLIVDRCAITGDRRVEGRKTSSQPDRTPIEAALRYLGTRNRGVLVDLLEYAIRRPQSRTGRALAVLVEASAVVDEWSPAERAYALWEVIEEGVADPDVSPTSHSRRRRALLAALRLPDTDIEEPWGASLTERFRQLQRLKSVFGDSTTTQPMEMAWKRGVESLAEYLEQRFEQLRTPADWERYRHAVREIGKHGPDGLPPSVKAPDRPEEILRQPSRGAQPIFVDLFVTNVFMKGRIVQRRITERLVTAQEDDVAYYTAQGFTSVWSRQERNYVPVAALWGCSAELVTATQPGEPIVTRLRFPKPLRKGQRAYFASETRFDREDDSSDDRRWVDVNVDHHGMPRGQLIHDDLLPVRGLTIRIKFDESDPPEAVWWYAEQTERERYIRPPDGDERFLSVFGNEVRKTFTEQPCQPRESYGIAFTWPHRIA